jgi:hypothetical protein
MRTYHDILHWWYNGDFKRLHPFLHVTGTQITYQSSSIPINRWNANDGTSQNHPKLCNSSAYREVGSNYCTCTKQQSTVRWPLPKLKHGLKMFERLRISRQNIGIFWAAMKFGTCPTLADRPTNGYHCASWLEFLSLKEVRRLAVGSPAAL